ncbi:MAG: DNA mismatch repair protein MutS [Armatimonadetes bacterium]|nr:DNA mismatch repair protein MutS [Armatimonadota bacterium]
MQGQFRPQTPMLQQYFRLKAEYPDVLLAMQVGDFYEFYGPDAEIAARELEIVLTGREDGSNGRIPMAGVPIHAYERYFAKLVQKGYRVAICDQIEDPKLAKGLVKRRVTRVLTPGAVLEDSMLDARANNYLVAAVLGDPIHGLGIVDVSTGEFLTTEIAGEGRQQKLLDELFRLQPAEVLVPEDQEELIQTLREQLSATITPTPLQEWVGREGREILLRHFGVESLRGFGCEEFTRGLDAAALALRYLQQNQMTALEHIRTLATYSVERFMYLDATARRHLELTQNLMDGTRRYTLLASIDSTCTPMGARLVKRWLDEPLLEPDAIAARLDAVDALAQQSIRRDALRQILRSLADLERLAARASTGTANARDLVALRQSLQRLPALHVEADVLLRELPQPPTLLATLAPRLAPLSDLCALLERALVDDPPADLKSGGVIRDGYDPELDRLRQVRTDGKQWIAQLEAKERQRTGISSLKVGYNAVFGYYLEVSKPHLNKVPADYIRKQTLANAERFITPELKEQEAILLGAEERINALEFELFSRVRNEVARCTPQLQSLAKAIAEWDVLCAFAENAVRYRYVRPVVDTEDRIHIVGGRHPVVERFSEKPFVPNDCRLDPTQRLIILTGPNMSGKCLSGETLVFTERGIGQLRDLAPPDAPLNAFAPVDVRVQTREGLQRATQFYSGGEQATIRLTTRLGFTLDGTPDHKVWTRREDGTEGWTRLGDLRPGDWVALARGFECWGNQTELPAPSNDWHSNTRYYRTPTHLTPDLAYWLGLLIGDGTITYRNAIVFSTKDPFLAEQFCELSERLFGYAPTRKANGKDYSISSTYLRRWLHEIGLDYATAATKRTPRCILCAPRECVVAYLQGLFDTDGYVARKYGNVFLTTASRQLALETQMLLLNLGIVASLRTKTLQKSSYYDLAIHGEDAIKFHQIVGFRLAQKQQRASLASEVRHPNKGGIPHLAPLLKVIHQRIVSSPTKRKSLKSCKAVESLFYTYIPNGRNPSYATLGHLIRYCHENQIDCHELDALVLQGYLYDRIIRLEPSRAVVYDLNIEPDHNYIAQGFISHNSTYIRQNALIVLMAHIGSFVPAERAEIGLVDRIFTRVGARDELATGQSTFMVEMTETASILNNATPRSLVILDEIGRGTSTYDGLAIAWAVAEYLHAIGCKTLFATHYHYLNELANRLEGVANYRVAVKEQGDRIVWLHKVLPGGTDRSYGVHVARMAGVPPEVVQRAEQILREFERRGVQGAVQPPTSDAPTIRTKKLQLTLFEAEAHPVLEALRALDITTLSPVEALLKLDELKRKLEE